MINDARRLLSEWNDPDDLLDALAQAAKGDTPGPEMVSAIEDLLSHNDSDVREEAARILFVVWKLRSHRQRAVEMLRNDPNAGVRGVSAYAVAATATPRTHRTDLRELIRTLRNEREDLEVRASAYDAILILMKRPAFPTKVREFKPDIDVDWVWLDELAQRIS